MEKLLFTLITIVFFSFNVTAQQSYPKGGYMSFDEILKKKPSQPFELEVTKRTQGDIVMYGGNDYKVVSPDKSVSKKIIKKEIWAYSDGDSLYINCFQYQTQFWYANLISDGKYLVFKGGLSMNAAEQKKQMQMGYYFGAVGGAIQGAKLAKLRFIYIIDKKENKVITVTPEILEELLGDDPELLTQYRNEEDKQAEDILVKYLRQLNET